MPANCLRHVGLCKTCQFREEAWDVSNASYAIISPQPGAVRGTSVSVSPAQTTTCTLDATNQYGRSMATVTVNVQ
jgi:hypothetical protein